MALLAAGTVVLGSSDPTTVEQRATIASITGKNSGLILRQYGDHLLLPNGQLSNDFSNLSIPASRRTEIQNAINNADLLVLDVNGVPIQELPTGPDVSPTPTGSILPPLIVNPGTPTVTNLNDIITIDALVIDRQYTKGTLIQIPPQIITITNTSTDIDVQVQLNGTTGAIFTPSSFLLHANSIQTSTLTFDIAQIDALPAGAVTMNLVVDLSSTTAILPPVEPIIPPPPIPPTTPLAPTIISPPPPPAPVAISGSGGAGSIGPQITEGGIPINDNGPNQKILAT